MTESDKRVAEVLVSRILANEPQATLKKDYWGVDILELLARYARYLEDQVEDEK